MRDAERSYDQRADERYERFDLIHDECPLKIRGDMRRVSYAPGAFPLEAQNKSL
jgi:hypothetical protein